MAGSVVAAVDVLPPEVLLGPDPRDQCSPSYFTLRPALAGYRDSARRRER